MSKPVTPNLLVKGGMEGIVIGLRVTPLVWLVILAYLVILMGIAR